MSSNSQNPQTPLIIGGRVIYIHIREDKNFNNHRLISKNRDPNDFVVEFTLIKRVNRNITSSSNNNSVHNNKDSKLLLKSMPLPFNPNRIHEVNTIDFSLCINLQLEKYIELRREVKRRMATYVELNPRPTTLSVTIVMGHEDEVLAILRVLKKVKVEEMEFKEEEEEKFCSICLVNFAKQKEGTVTCMPCNHVFHDNCILKWLFKNPNCPLCRLKLDFKI